MAHKFPLLSPALAIAAALSLAACGGGSSSGVGTPPPNPSNPNPTNPTTVVSTSGTIQATPAAPTYAASSVQGGLYAKLNDLRARAGAGVMNQSAAIDVAAQAHADYQHANGVVTHNEILGSTGYYADTPSARIAKAGYQAASTNETIGGTGASMLGADCARGLLATLYHGAALLGPYTDVGNGSSTDALGIPTCVTDMATTSTSSYPQVPASGALIAYPYSGQTDAIEIFYVSYESPRPPVAALPSATAGTPVLISIRNADYVNLQAAGTLAATVSKYEMRDSAQNLVPSVILASPGIVGGSGITIVSDATLLESFAVLVPLSPLVKGASYTVAFSATLKSGGDPLTKTWSFTTNQ